MKRSKHPQEAPWVTFVTTEPIGTVLKCQVTARSMRFWDEVLKTPTPNNQKNSFLGIFPSYQTGRGFFFVPLSELVEKTLKNSRFEPWVLPGCPVRAPRTDKVVELFKVPPGQRQTRCHKAIDLMPSLVATVATVVKGYGNDDNQGKRKEDHHKQDRANRILSFWLSGRRSAATWKPGSDKELELLSEDLLLVLQVRTHHRLRDRPLHWHLAHVQIEHCFWQNGMGQSKRWICLRWLSQASDREWLVSASGRFCWFYAPFLTISFLASLGRCRSPLYPHMFPHHMERISWILHCSCSPILFPYSQPHQQCNRRVRGKSTVGGKAAYTMASTSRSREASGPLNNDCCWYRSCWFSWQDLSFQYAQAGCCLQLPGQWFCGAFCMWRNAVRALPHWMISRLTHRVS